MLCWKLSILQFTFQIIQTLKRLWSHVHHYTFFTIFRDSLFTSFQYSWTWKVQLGASHPCQSSIFILKFLVVSQSQVSLFVSCITSIPPQISSENNKKKQFISTIIKNSMQTVEVKSTSSHNCLSQNDDATLNSWSQVCRWSYIWLISGTGTLYKNMLVSIGYQNFYFDFVIQTIDRRRIYDWMWENHQTLRANGSTTFFLRFMKHFIRLNLYQIIKS